MQRAAAIYKCLLKRPSIARSILNLKITHGLSQMHHINYKSLWVPWSIAPTHTSRVSLRTDNFSHLCTMDLSLQSGRHKIDKDRCHLKIGYGQIGKFRGQNTLCRLHDCFLILSCRSEFQLRNNIRIDLIVKEISSSGLVWSGLWEVCVYKISIFCYTDTQHNGKVSSSWSSCLLKRGNFRPASMEDVIYTHAWGLGTLACQAWWLPRMYPFEKPAKQRSRCIIKSASESQYWNYYGKCRWVCTHSLRQLDLARYTMQITVTTVSAQSTCSTSRSQEQCNCMSWTCNSSLIIHWKSWKILP